MNAISNRQSTDSSYWKNCKKIGKSELRNAKLTSLYSSDKKFLAGIPKEDVPNYMAKQKKETKVGRNVLTEKWEASFRGNINAASVLESGAWKFDINLVDKG